ncbi:MAG: N-acetyltransferase [Phycisphaerae bacterium]|nr:N-acetyltransferase [Phycisphaerae bacterium]
MSIRLRSEVVGDEDAIDVVNCTAFERMEEANLVRMLRAHYPGFDRRYSVTAWEGDDIVGHTLLSPVTIRLMGENVAALMVGPVAVAPGYQRRGIGGGLLRFGHEMGQRDGFALAFLYGHPEYYPRHGYRACFGLGKVTIDKDGLPEPKRKFTRMPVCPADLPWLVERYAAEWADVDFATLWGPSLGEWTMPCLNAVMWWTEDGCRAAYTVDKPGKERCRMLLADDPELARDVIATIRPGTLSHHPSGWLVRHALDVDWAAAEAERSEAAMACELESGALDECLRAVESGERLPGFALGSLPFLAI